MRSKLARYGLILLALACFSASSALAGSGEPSPLARVNALWVAESDGTLKIATADGELLFEIQGPKDVRAVAVDPTRMTVWLYAESALAAYDFDGERLFAVPVGPAESLPTYLTVNESDGSVWLGVDKALWSFSASGEELASLDLSDPVQALDVDPAESLLWVGTPAGVTAYDAATGDLAQDLPLSGVQDLDADAVAGGLWIVHQDHLRRYDADRNVLFDLLLPGAARVAADGQGGAWAAADKQALRISASGEALVSLTPFGTDGEILALAADPADGSLWVAGQSSVVHVDAGGQLRHVLDIAPPVEIRDLAVSSDTLRPALEILAPVNGSFLPTGTPAIRVAYSDLGAGVDPDTLTFSANGSPLAVACSFAADGATCTPASALPDGQLLLAAAVRDFAGNPSAQAQTVFTVDTIAPAPVDTGRVTVSQAAGGQATVTGSAGAAEPGATVSISNLRTGATATATAGADGSFSATLATQAGDSLSIVLTDTAGNRSAARTVTVPGTSEPGLPPDPATVAPPLDPTVAPDIAASTEFLYTGANPIQTGVAPGAIDPERVAVLRGRVLDRSGEPLPGARITLLGHPEYGSTLSRADGMFDMAANGGGVLIVQYEKQGYLTAQRSVSAPWRDYVWAEDAVLVPYDSRVTTIAADAPQLQVARGSRVEDEDGTRTATVLFPASTHAMMVKADGTTQALSTLSVRATEYTVGPSGPAAMPAPLPPASGYTYAVELSADEATAAGAKKVVFNQPVFFYVENFAGFPVGSEVPTGSYDRDLGAWVPYENGRVIRILGNNEGLADLDVDGTNSPADAAKLAALGITDDERRQLASLYQPGQSLWRSPIPHFTPWDCNWPYGPPDDAEAPNQPQAEPEDDRDENPDCQAGSIIDCQNRALGEAVPIVGTPFNLHYRSDRVPGRTAALRMTIPLSGSHVPSSLKAIRLRVMAAGQLFEWTFPGLPNQRYSFVWNRTDSYGRTIKGKVSLFVDIGYVYDTVYQGANTFRSFARFSGVPISGVQGRQEITIHQQYEVALGAVGIWEAAEAGLGGWTLSAHHFFDPDSHALHLGNGETRTSQSPSYGRTISSPPQFSGLASARCITTDPDGNFYLCTSSRVVKVTPSGIVTTVAGTGIPGSSGDGGPGLFAQLRTPVAIAVDPRGNIFIADRDDCRVRRVDPQATVTTVAGAGPPFCSGYSPLFDDGRPATQVGIDPEGVAVDREGNLYIADSDDNYVLKVGLDGLIYRIAGNGATFDTPGNLPTSFSMRGVRGIAFDPSGNLYIADFARQRVFRLEAGGTVTRLAELAFLFHPFYISISRSGEILIDNSPGEILKLLPNGSLVRIAGNRTDLVTGDGGPAAAAGIGYDTGGLAFDPAGNLYRATGLNKIRKISTLLPGFTTDDETLISSEDGEEVWVFNGQGKHLRTVSATTGATLLSFHYDPLGYLSTIEDGDGNITRIERDPAGAPSAIVGPFGQRTTLALDANGYLARVENPAGEATRFAYSADGLLLSMTNPREYTTTFAYDALGFLSRDSDPAGGFKQLGRSVSPSGTTVSVETAEGRRWEYTRQKTASGGEQKSTLLPTGLRRNTVIDTNGSMVVTYPDGTTTTLIEGSDPRFGMESPVASTFQMRTPSGLVSTWTRTRTATLQSPGDPLSLISSIERVDVNGRSLTRTFDAGQRKFTFTSAAGRTKTATLDTIGRPVLFEVDGMAPMSFTYDARGRLSSITQGSGTDERVFTLTYSTDGWLSDVFGPLSYHIGFEHDAAGRVVRQTLPGGRIIAFSYDAKGNLTSLTPPTRPSHTFGLTPVDLPAEYAAPAIGQEPNRTTYSYNPDRQLTMISRPDERNVGMSYGTDGRLFATSFSLGQLGFTYQPETGNLSGVSAPQESLSYTYDGLLQTGTTWSGTVAGSISSTFDSDFRLKTQRVNGANSITFQYDPDGFITQAGALTLTWSPQNSLLTGTALGQVTTTQSYNAFGELSDFTASFQETPLYAVSYTRDQLGRILQKVETIGGVTDTFDYTYDSAERLTDVARSGAALSHYDYDGNSNRTSYTNTSGTVTANYDEQDRLLSYGDLTYTYSANGELESKAQNGQTVTYSHDELGNLRNVNLPGGIAIEYVIDGQGRRVGKKVNASLGLGFLYEDQLQPVAELDGTGAVVSRFVYGSGANLPDYMIKGGVTYRIISDHLGSPRLVVNTTTGQIVQRMDYDEFGRVILDTNPGFQPFGFAGGLYDRQTDLVRFGMRDYDSEVGRWTVKDPILFRGGSSNLYSYALDDPINYRDSLGLRQCAQILVTGTTTDPVRHIAIYIFDSITGSGTVYSHGGIASGRNTLEGYLGSYNPVEDPTTRYPLDLTNQEVHELADALEYDFNGAGRFPQYDAFTNNCAQYSKKKILHATKLPPIRSAAGLAVDLLNGPDLSTNAVLGSLMAYGLIGGSCR